MVGVGKVCEYVKRDVQKVTGIGPTIKKVLV